MFLISATWASTPNTLIFLNQPESVYHTGVLGRIEVTAGEHYRVFFHYVNKTKTKQIFQITGPLQQTVGGTSVQEFPGPAGSAAAALLLDQMPASFPIKTMVMVGQTVSGVIDGIASKNGSVIAQLGASTKMINGSKVVLSPYVWQNVEVNNSLPSVAFSLGQDIAPIFGSYGAMFHFEVTNPSKHTQKVTITFSPRGGDMILAYQLQGHTHTSPMIAGRHIGVLFSGKLHPGDKLNFNTVNAGGWNFPVRFEISRATLDRQ